LLTAVWLVGCPSPQERAERARADVRAALARGDRNAAIRALEVLRGLRAETGGDPLELAQLLVQAGEAPQAVWLLDEAVRQSPDRDELRLALARVALLVGDAAAARAALEPIGEDSERHLDALMLRAQVELKLGDFDRAVATLTSAEELYPERTEPRLVRIAALLREHRLEEARRAIDEERGALIAGEQSDALRSLQIALYAEEAQTGSADAAIAGLRALVDEQPHDLAAWDAFTRAMLRAGRLDEATRAVQAALERDPKNTELLPVLASLHTAANRPDEARRALRELVDRSPSPNAYLALARHYSGQRDDEGMVDTFEEAIRKFPDDPLIQRTRAEALLSAGKIEPGRKAIGDYAARFPDDPNTEYLRARLELADGDANAAAKRLEQVLPRIDQSGTQHWLGRALEAAGDRAGADRHYELALVRDPFDPALFGPPIALAERRGDWRRSAALARRVVVIAPGQYFGWAALVGGLVQQGAAEDAVKIARGAAELFADRADAKLLLVRALRANGEYDAALALLGEIDRGSEAKTPDAAVERILTLGMAGRFDEGFRAADAALAAHPDSAALHTAHASLLFGAGRADDGSRAVDRALELAPDDLQPLAIRARFEAATGRLDAARRDAELYLKQRPDDAETHFVLGAVHERSGNAEQAIASYRRAAALDPNAFEPRNNLALLLAERDIDGALAAGQEAYALRPKDPAVLDTLGELYLRKGLVDRATSLLEEAHAGAPEQTEIGLHLALAHRRAGRTEDARRMLVALARDNASPELRARIDEALRSLQ
jgi:tetratricopeptide (TPR) repeat protein